MKPDEKPWQVDGVTTRVKSLKPRMVNYAEVVISQALVRESLCRKLDRWDNERTFTHGPTIWAIGNVGPFGVRGL